VLRLARAGHGFMGAAGPGVSLGMHASTGPVVWLSLVMLGCGDKPGGSAEAGGSETTLAGGSTGSTSSSGGAGTEVPTGGADESVGGHSSSGAEMLSSGDASTGEGETTSGGTTGGPGGVCVDPRAPGCTACAAMGQPQRLFGLTWNFAMGEAGSGLGSEELRCVVPETGESDLIAEIPGMDWLPVGMNAYDREAEILYALAYANADDITRVFSIGTITGDVLGDPAVAPQAFNWSGGLHVRSDGALVGVTWNPDVLQEEVHALDPATGQTTFINAVPEIASLYQAVYAFDRAVDHAFMIGNGGGDGTHLFVVDLMDGALVGAPVFAEPLAWSAGIFVRADGQLVGVVIANGTSRLLTIDRETAATATIAEIQGLGPVVLGGAVYDDVADTILVVDAAFRLVQVDATTGEVVAAPALAGPPNPMFEYNWSGGLHVR